MLKRFPILLALSLIALSCESAAGPIPTPTPDIPSAVVAQLIEPNTVALSWTDRSSGIISFEIEERRDPDATWKSVSILAPTANRERRFGLNPGTYHYHVRACANTSCSAFSPEATVTVPRPIFAPIAFTHPASTITQTSAELSGTVGPNNGATTAWFEWSTDSAFTGEHQLQAENIDSAADTVLVRSTVAQLSPATRYYFRLRAENAMGSSRSEILNFTTAAKQ